jgi:hypothetical protein
MELNITSRQFLAFVVGRNLNFAKVISTWQPNSPPAGDLTGND